MRTHFWYRGGSLVKMGPCLECVLSTLEKSQSSPIFTLSIRTDPKESTRGRPHAFPDPSGVPNPFL